MRLALTAAEGCTCRQMGRMLGTALQWLMGDTNAPALRLNTVNATSMKKVVISEMVRHRFTSSAALPSPCNTPATRPRVREWPTCADLAVVAMLV